MALTSYLVYFSTLLPCSMSHCSVPSFICTYSSPHCIFHTASSILHIVFTQLSLYTSQLSLYLAAALLNCGIEEGGARGGEEEEEEEAEEEEEEGVVLPKEIEALFLHERKYPMRMPTSPSGVYVIESIGTGSRMIAIETFMEYVIMIYHIKPL